VQLEERKGYMGHFGVIYLKKKEDNCITVQHQQKSIQFARQVAAAVGKPDKKDTAAAMEDAADDASSSCAEVSAEQVEEEKKKTAAAAAAVISAPSTTAAAPSTAAAVISAAPTAASNAASEQTAVGSPSHDDSSAAKAIEWEGEEEEESKSSSHECCSEDHAVMLRDVTSKEYLAGCKKCMQTLAGEALLRFLARCEQIYDEIASKEPHIQSTMNTIKRKIIAIKKDNPRVKFEFVIELNGDKAEWFKADLAKEPLSRRLFKCTR
jgi:hypothetical protein